MNYTAQIILAVRNFDVEGWTDILVIIVLVVFWAVGSIVKARARAKAKSDGLRAPDRRDQPRRRATPVPSDGSRGRQIQHHPRIRPPRRKVVRPAHAAVRLQIIKPPQQAELTSLTPPQTGIKEGLESVGKPLKKLEDKLPGLSAKTAQTVPAAELAEPEPAVLDFGDPDELKRAVLHYEILGKPISLRDRTEQIIKP